MREQFLPSGRVTYFPMCDYSGDGKFRSLLSGEEYDVDIRKRTVDGTFFKTSVPATHKRKFTVDDGVACAPPNDLPRRAGDHKRFTTIGGGKTAMDAGVFLLDNGADPNSITWIISRDSWIINRATTQHGPAFFEKSVGGFATQLEASAAAQSVSDLFLRLESAGVMFRLDPDITPTMFHYATISQGEIAQLRRIRNVNREGRAARLSSDFIEMQNGARVPAQPDTLYIDCSATAVDFGGGRRPIFEDGRITLQSLYSPLVTLSASIIGYVEARYATDAEKNFLCEPNILADTPAEWMQSFLGNLGRQQKWSQDPELIDWINRNRLSPFGKAIDKSVLDAPEKAAILARIQSTSGPAVMNLMKLISETAP